MPNELGLPNELVFGSVGIIVAFAVESSNVDIRTGYPHNTNGFAVASRVCPNILLRKRIMIKMLLSGGTYDLPMTALDQGQI